MATARSIRSHRFMGPSCHRGWPSTPAVPSPFMHHADYYANAFTIEPGRCFRMVMQARRRTSSALPEAGDHLEPVAV